MDEVSISAQEADVCGDGKGQFRGIWSLDFSHGRPCNAHTMVGDKYCSKTGHSPDNLQYHKPNSAGQQLVDHKARTSVNDKMKIDNFSEEIKVKVPLYSIQYA